MDVPRGRPAPSPSTGLDPAHPYQPPPGGSAGLCSRVGAAGGGGDPATAQALAPTGPGLLLAATGGHYMRYTAALP